MLFESQSTVVWLAAPGTPVNHLLNTDLVWLKRQKLNIRPENAVGIDVLAHEPLQDIYRSLETMGVLHCAMQTQYQMKFLLLQLMWPLLIPPSKFLGILQCKEKSTLFS